MRINAIVRSLKKSGKKVIFVIRKKAPDILIAIGIGAGVAGTVSACVSTVKAVPQYDDMKRKIEVVEKKTGTESETVKKDVRKIKLDTAANIVKNYAIPVALCAISGTSVLASHQIIKRRNVALVAAYTALDQGFKAYRANVIDTMGEEADQKFRLGEKDISLVDQKTGEIVEHKNVAANKNLPSEYVFYFDQASVNYTPNDDEMNIMFINAQQRFAMNKLVADGYLFLNDVFDLLGLPRNKMGQVVGWIYDDGKTNDSRDNYVDFRTFVTTQCDENGHDESKIVLDFNCDGPILSDFESSQR